MEGLKLKSARISPDRLVFIRLFSGFRPLKKSFVAGTHAGVISAPIRYSTGRLNPPGIESEAALAEKHIDMKANKRYGEFSFMLWHFSKSSRMSDEILKNIETTSSGKRYPNANLTKLYV